jgi:hypothetical protein
LIEDTVEEKVSVLGLELATDSCSVTGLPANGFEPPGAGVALTAFRVPLSEVR